MKELQYWERVKEGDLVLVTSRPAGKNLGRVAGMPTAETTPIGFEAGHDPELISSRNIVPFMSNEHARRLHEVLEETKEWSKKE